LSEGVEFNVLVNTITCTGTDNLTPNNQETELENKLNEKALRETQTLCVGCS